MPSHPPAPVLHSDTEWEALLQQAMERQEKLADSQLEMARMFVERGKPEIARRRLAELIADYPLASTAPAARKLLAELN